MDDVFKGSFTQQPPLPESAIEAAVAALRHGRLHRYNQVPGELPEAARLERAFADYTGAKYCVAVTSGGSAMALALRAAGVRPGDRVLSNAFTLAPVPGAIAAVAAHPVFVGVTRQLTIDLGDLAAKIATSGARVLLLSHMRGHICDMDALMTLCDAHGISVIEDCAHTMGGAWRGTKSGQHGLAACYSTQTYKHMNSGEGGFLTTNDATVAARAILMSGSYMFFDRHGAAPDPEFIRSIAPEMPNMSCRMDNLRAAILRPQLAGLDAAVDAWEQLYRAIERGLRGVSGLDLIRRPPEERFVGSSFQFLMPDADGQTIAGVVARCEARGVMLKWFGAPRPHGFTSTYRHWAYADAPPMPDSDRVLHGILDMRLPLTFSLEDCALIARIIGEEVRRSGAARTAAE